LKSVAARNECSLSAYEVLAQHNGMVKGGFALSIQGEILPPAFAAMRGLSEQARQELKSCLTLLLRPPRANPYHAAVSGL
jgi:hypothetical protein